jgi:hypothetical protein
VKKHTAKRCQGNWHVRIDKDAVAEWQRAIDRVDWASIDLPRQR